MSLSKVTLPALPGIYWPAVFTLTSIFVAGYLTSAYVNSATASTMSEKPAHHAVTSSPRSTLLPKLTTEQQLNLPYPPDALPGARDVNTPYGSIRVYEFGPATGRKVFLIHGISTPCLALGGLAETLVERYGCRVCLFDLPGRGYSDAPEANSAGSTMGVRFFTSVAMMVLASSHLNWFGADSRTKENTSGPGFDIIGYSLGGGISAAFTSYFPNLVRSVVLIAPSGIIRTRHFSRINRIIYSKGVIPEPILMRIVKKRLMKTVPEPKKQNERNVENGDVATTIDTAVNAEINVEANQQGVLSKRHPDVTIEAAVNHQVLNHEGFVPAFMSSIRNGPIANQHEDWKRIGAMLTQRKQKALVVLGRRDPVIIMQETQEDASQVFEGNVEFVIVDAGHEAPVSKGPEVADHIWNFWEKNGI